MINMADKQSRGVEESEQETKSIGNITAKLSIDVKDALKGLKAVQREARRATRSLRELEEQQKKNSSLPTEALRTDNEFQEALDDVKDVVDRFCPNCNSGILGIESVYAHHKEKPIHTYKKCRDCGWVSNE